jgi:diamine N-acetyltransferase
MAQLNIVKASILDIETLQTIGKQTFFETFAEVNTEENMANYLAESFSIEKLLGELSNSESEFYFAKIEEKVIGYLKINSGNSQTEQQANSSLEIERIYVLSEFKGKKVGQALYEKAMQIAQQKQVKFVWLGVWEENKSAIQFYTKNGFVAFDSHVFMLGDDKQTDILMKIEI